MQHTLGGGLWAALNALERRLGDVSETRKAATRGLLRAAAEIVKRGPARRRGAPGRNEPRPFDTGEHRAKGA